MRVVANFTHRQYRRITDIRAGEDRIPVISRFAFDDLGHFGLHLRPIAHVELVLKMFGVVAQLV